MKQGRRSHLLPSNEWANSRLCFGIKLLQGKAGFSDFDNAVSEAVSIRWALANAGMWWQAKKLDEWINVTKKKGDFLI
ncbi:MAG: hypothetical protein O8C61_03275 [Candidatus Methanoperedens sp.]|nr:hypothetical protein [Candidatus Methanoperedens sp.]